MTHIIKFLLFILLLQSLLLAGCGPKTRTAHDPEFVNAQEFKLKVRELADQMLATMDNRTLMGLVAMPTSFVDMNSKNVTSSFGNLLGESLIYEFNQRGFPVREYRLTGNIDVKLGQGDFALLRQGIINTNERWAALIIGTYHTDKEAVFVNARLVRAMDGMVLRTGQLVLVKTPLIERLTAAPIIKSTPKPVVVSTTSSRARYVSKPPVKQGPPPPPLGLRSGTLNIVQVPNPSEPEREPGLYGTPR